VIAEVGRLLKDYFSVTKVKDKTVTVKLGCYCWGADTLILGHGHLKVKRNLRGHLLRTLT